MSRKEQRYAERNIATCCSNWRDQEALAEKQCNVTTSHTVMSNQTFTIHTKIVNK